MLHTTLAIARLHLRIVLQPLNMIALIAMPLLFTLLLGLADGGSTSTSRWLLLVSNQDRGSAGAALVAHLQASPLLELQQTEQAAGQQRVAQGQAPALLVIAPEFSAGLQARQPTELQLISGPAAQSARPLIAAAVGAATDELSALVASAAVAAQRAKELGLANAPSFEQLFQQSEARWQAERPLRIHSAPVARADLPQGAAQSSPGMLVMFSMFFLVAGGAVTFVEERQNGTLRRLAVMPLSRTSLLLGKLLGIYLSGVLQIAVLILAGLLLFRVNWGSAPLALILVACSFALAATGLGLLLGVLARTSAQASGLSALFVLLASALGGAWWPLEIVPSWLQRVAWLLPTGWAISGFQQIITNGLGVAAVLPHSAVLLGFAALGLSLGLWRFRYT